jgi:hypothetical protein
MKVLRHCKDRFLQQPRALWNQREFRARHDERQQDLQDQVDRVGNISATYRIKDNGIAASRHLAEGSHMRPGGSADVGDHAYTMYPADKGGDTMKQRWIVVLVAALTFTGVFGFPASGWAAETFRAVLNGGKEVPVCSTAGSGTLELVVPDDQSRIDFLLQYALEGSVMVAHIHLGKRTEAGGVIVFFCGGGGKPDCPPSPAAVSGTMVAGDILGPAGQGIAPGEFGELLRAIRSGQAYANVHSNICPSGEVRGQIR